MALKYITTEIPLTAIEAGILKKIGFNVVNEKCFIDERKIKSDRSSVGRKSKAKGGTFERRVATALSVWWSDGESKDEFSKTPRSGAWKFPQDLVPPQHCPFLISCKNEESWTGVEKILSTDKHRFMAYWEELMDSYYELGKTPGNLFTISTVVPFEKIIPMVIFTRNHDTNYLMLRLTDYIALDSINANNFEVDERKLVSFQMNSFGSGGGKKNAFYMLVLLNDFLDWLRPADVKQYVQRQEN